MCQMIQALEPRMLMSVTADTLTTDAATIDADAKIVMSSHVTRYTTVNKDVATIAADLVPLETKTIRASNKFLLKALRKIVNFYNAEVAGDVAGLLAAARHAASAGSASGQSLLLHPTSAAFLKLVSKDITYIDNVFTAKLNALLPELVDALEDGFIGYYTSFASVNPSLTDVTNAIINDVTTKTAAVTTAANQLQTDTDQLASDLGEISGVATREESGQSPLNP